MPGVQNVIGSHNLTIFRGRALKNCTKMNTKSEQENEQILTAERSEDSHRKPKVERLVSRKSRPDAGVREEGFALNLNKQRFCGKMQASDAVWQRNSGASKEYEVGLHGSNDS
jgi:hypothetical protein